MKADACLSACGRYRYRLTRAWDEARYQATWIMLNPSTADATKDDPTVRRVVAFSLAWGLGGVTVVNLFALRSPSPAALYKAPDPVGPENDRHVVEACRGAGLIVAAWGAHGNYRQRGLTVWDLLRREGVRGLKCLGRTKRGEPRHPLYVAANAPLVPWL